MSDQLETLIDIAAWVDTEERMSAMEWAIDQLRWRRVDDEVPDEGKHLIEWLHPLEPSTHVTPIQNSSTVVWARAHGFTHWRPIELPEES